MQISPPPFFAQAFEHCLRCYEWLRAYRSLPAFNSAFAIPPPLTTPRPATSGLAMGESWVAQFDLHSLEFELPL